jgi:hypothetical protein
MTINYKVIRSKENLRRTQERRTKTQMIWLKVRICKCLNHLQLTIHTRTWTVSFQRQDLSPAWTWQNRKITKINYKRKLTDFRDRLLHSSIKMMDKCKNPFLTWTTKANLCPWEWLSHQILCQRFSNPKRPTRRNRTSHSELRPASSSSRNPTTRVTKILTAGRKTRLPTKFAAGGISIFKVPTWRRPSSPNHPLLTTTCKDHSMLRSRAP